MTPSTPGFPALLQEFFQRLVSERGVSAHTIASYRDTFELLLGYAQKRTGRTPSALTLEDLDAAREADGLVVPGVGAFAAAFALVQFFASPVLGALSDAYGRRTVILISAFGMAADPDGSGYWLGASDGGVPVAVPDAAQVDGRRR